MPYNFVADSIQFSGLPVSICQRTGDGRFIRRSYILELSAWRSQEL